MPGEAVSVGRGGEGEGCGPEGGGHSGPEWLPNAKQLCRAEAVNIKTRADQLF